MHRDALDALDPLLHQGIAVGVRKKRHVLAHHEDMQPIALRRALLDEVAVAEGERIGVHHHRADLRTKLAASGKPAAVAEAPIGVFSISAT